MKKKSTTQMTKVELIEKIKEQNEMIDELNASIAELRSKAITTDAFVLDQDDTPMLKYMRDRITELEAIVDESNKNKK